MKEQKGITLVALVITIIVLLILAGVSLSIISGDDGILTNASKAKDQTAMSTAKEAVVMKVQSLTTEYYEGVYVSGDIKVNETNCGSVGEYIHANIYGSYSGYTVSEKSGETEFPYTVTVTGGDMKSTDKVEATLAADGSLTWKQ